MKVLLCSPYKDGHDIVRGGINQWAKNILLYHKDHNDGVEIIPISFDRHITRIHSKNALQRFVSGVKEQISPLRDAVKVLKNVKPDVIHICTSAGLGSLRDLLLVRIARRYHVRSIVHLHFGRLPDIAENKNWEWRLVLMVLKRCDVIVPMNHPTERVLHDIGMNNVRYLPNPLSDIIERQVSEYKEHFQREAGRLLFVGHAYQTKGIFELVKGCKDIEGVKLRIVGKCSYEMKETLLSIGMNSINKDWIVFVGEISHEDVLKEFLMADIFVFPSYTEGFPNVILESMACGCPIIASRVGSIPEMLDSDNEPCGVCIPPKSSKAVHNAVISLLNDKAQKEKYAEAALQRVYSLYTMPKVWNELVSIWKS